MSARASQSTWLAVLACILSITIPAGAKTIYVDDDATGANDGTSWENAYFYLQDALMFAVSGDEICVAQGTYRPDDFVLSDRPNLGREETFQLLNGVTLKGGYAGSSQANQNERTVDLYESILSGDRDGDDEPNFVNNEENSLHVVTAISIDETAVLDGFVVTAGNADGYDWPDGAGAGMRNYNASPRIYNCRFVANYSGNNDGGAAGGGVYNEYAAPVLKDCAFLGNCAIALDGGEGMGGGVANYNSEVTLVNCTFIANTSGHDGGGVYSYASVIDATNCLFSGNLARWGGSGSYGGGLYNYDCGVRLRNCTVAQNAALGYYGGAGGGMYSRFYTSPSIRNCIFWGNVDEDGMGESAQIGGSGGNIKYSCVEGWDGGSTRGNMSDDPCFASLGYWLPGPLPDIDSQNIWVNGDYHLKSQAGRWGTNDGRWVMDEVMSPCIDAGDPMMPMGFEPFPNGGIMNMGAYGGTAEASKSYFGEAPCETIVAGDVNGDCAVNFLDFGLMALHWMEER